MSEWRAFKADDPSTNPPTHGLTYLVYGATGYGLQMWSSQGEWIGGSPSPGPIRCWFAIPRVPDEFR